MQLYKYAQYNGRSYCFDSYVRIYNIGMDLSVSRSVIHKRGNGWCLPFPGADNSIVRRTQRALHAARGGRPVQFRAYLDLGGFLPAVLMLIGAAGLLLFSK